MLPATRSVAPHSACRNAELSGAAEVPGRQLAGHPARVGVGEDHGVRGEPQHPRVPGRGLRQDRDPAVGGREPAAAASRSTAASVSPRS